jgi:hypothetical protein
MIEQKRAMKQMSEDPILQIVNVLVTQIVKDKIPSKQNQDLLVHWAFQLTRQVEIFGSHLKGPQKLRVVQCALLELVNQKAELFVDTLPQDFIHEMIPIIVSGAIGLTKNWAPMKSFCCSL